MKFFHTLRQDLNKTVLNIGFLGAALMTCLLCFTATAYTDPSNQKSYTIMEAFYSFDKQFVQSNKVFASVRLFTSGLSGYITMFIPIIVAFPFMVSFCSERNNGLMRFTISRTGKLRYYLSKFFASFLGGGLAVLIGLVLYGIAVYIMFPSLSSYPPDPWLTEFEQPGEIEMVVRMLASGFIYGAFSTLPAFLLSSFCKNPYIITCLPFMLVYIWTTAIRKLQFKAFENYMDFDQSYYDKLAAFSPDSPQYVPGVFFDEMSDMLKYVLWFNGIYLAVILIGFIVIMNLRIDKGN